MCRLLEGPVSQELCRVLQPASSATASPRQHAAASAAIADVAAATDGLATAALRHRIAAPAALRLLQRLLRVLAAVAGVCIPSAAAHCSRVLQNIPSRSCPLAVQSAVHPS